MKRKREHFFRYVVLGAFYVAVCLLFTARLINIQIAGQDYYQEAYNDGYYYRNVTIKAQRGEIFDRNGKALVTNSYTYDLYLDAGSIPKDNDEMNQFILHILRLAEDFGEYEDSFTVPDMPFMQKDGEWTLDQSFMQSAYGKRLTRLLTDLHFTPDSDDGGWEKEDKGEMRETLLYRYGIVGEDMEAKYSQEDSDLLFALRLDMELSYFSTAEPYTILEDIGKKYIAAVTEGTVRGIGIICEAERVYNYPGYASHILGRTGKIMAENAQYYTDKGYKLNAIVGTSGAESAFEDYLHGEDGVLTIVEDEFENVVDTFVSKEPKAGQDVYLTIDIDLQMDAEKALESNIQMIVANAEADDKELTGEDANAGALVAIEKNSGAVLAIASYPTYDLSTFNENYQALREDENAPLFNRALEGTYAPGSTFKPGVAVAALQEDIITPYTEIYGAGKYTYYADFQPSCWRAGCHGNINVSTAIQVSCNYFFYDIGRQLTISNITKYCEKYGLGQPTGIELTEKVGILASPAAREANGETWYDGDTIQAAIGQSDNLFKPLQISSYIATLLNGGTRYSAHLLYEVREYDGRTVYTAEPKIASTISLDSQNVSTVKYAMKGVMEASDGSAVRVFANYPIAVGGKTGTAQVSKTSSDNALFVAFAPFDDPEIVVSCVIEHGAKGTDAGFAIRDVFDSYFGLNEDDDDDEGGKDDGTTNNDDENNN